MAWTIADAAGTKGSPSLLGLIVASSLSALIVLGLLLWAGRWALVYSAVKQFVAHDLWGRAIHEDTILVGGSGGGGIAVGMVAKAVQELYGCFLAVTVIDQDYIAGHFEPLTGRFIQIERELLAERRPLYVTSYVGTGRSRHAILQTLGIETCPTFAFVVDEAARDVVEFYLATGRRRIIPWPR